MDVEEIDLCAFCSDLVLAPLNETDLPSQRPHHPTYELLSSSSNTCALCRSVRSLWSNFDTDLQRRGVADETIRRRQDGMTVKITVTAARRMQSGTSWKCAYAAVFTGLTPMVYSRRFTLVACPLASE